MKVNNIASRDRCDMLTTLVSFPSNYRTNCARLTRLCNRSAKTAEQLPGNEAMSELRKCVRIKALIHYANFSVTCLSMPLRVKL